ncbi:MAG TPA: hypothetical protein VF720_15655, partial [Candidatus Eisenbacteria bacterium]
ATNDVWTLTNANGSGGTPVWSPATPTGTPPSPRRRFAFHYDATAKRALVYGGDDPCGAPSGDVFVLNNADGTGGTPAWTSLPLSNGGAPAGSGIAGTYDGTTNRLLALGGRGADGTTLLPDVVIIEKANGVSAGPNWTLLPPPSTAPPARERSAVAFEAPGQRLMAFGGLGASGPLNDTWVLQLTSASGTVVAVPEPVGQRPGPGLAVGAVAPNPSRGALGFTVELDRVMAITGTLFDVGGRRVASVLDEELRAGAHRFAWDSRRSGGSPPASGTYFLVIEGEGARQVRRVTIVR